MQQGSCRGCTWWALLQFNLDFEVNLQKFCSSEGAFQFMHPQMFGSAYEMLPNLAGAAL